MEIRQFHKSITTHCYYLLLNFIRINSHLEQIHWPVSFLFYSNINFFFRCFVHDKDYKDGVVRMGVSVSATCNGLPSPTQGDKVFTMERGKLGLI